MREGCYDVDRRVRDMDANGVLGSMCFPSFPQLCGQVFARTEDKDAALAILRAYNDWQIDDWCGSHPGRFIPLALPPIWDPQAMADEVRRVAAKGCHAASFSENPSKLRLPSFHTDHWDPFWAACADEGTIVCLHIGSSSELVVTAADAPIDVLITLQPINIVQAAADLLWSPVLRKFPTLRFALSEGGIGWIPYFFDRVDWIYQRHHYWTGQDFGALRPPDEGHRHRRRQAQARLAREVGDLLAEMLGVDGDTGDEAVAVEVEHEGLGRADRSAAHLDDLGELDGDGVAGIDAAAPL